MYPLSSTDFEEVNKLLPGVELMSFLNLDKIRTTEDGTKYYNSSLVWCHYQSIQKNIKYSLQPHLLTLSEMEEKK